MKRDATTPLILWICAAICVHFLFGGGASEVAADDRPQAMEHLELVVAHHVRAEVRQQHPAERPGADPRELSNLQSR